MRQGITAAALLAALAGCAGGGDATREERVAVGVQATLCALAVAEAVRPIAASDAPDSVKALESAGAAARVTASNPACIAAVAGAAR
jgi:hypothetical protein